MNAADLIVVLGLLGLIFWGVPRIFRSVGEDQRWPEVLRKFADRHQLRETQADDAHSRQMPTVGEILQRQRKNPALRYPPPGSTVLQGKLADQPIFVDQVFVKTYFGGRFFIYLRMAVALPDAPTGLRVFPAGRLRRIIRNIRGNAEQLVVQHAKDPGSRAREESFLTGWRRRQLEEAQGSIGGIHIARGKLYLIRQRGGKEEVDLDRMYRQISELEGRLRS